MRLVNGYIYYYSYYYYYSNYYDNTKSNHKWHFRQFKAALI